MVLAALNSLVNNSDAQNQLLTIKHIAGGNYTCARTVWFLHNLNWCLHCTSRGITCYLSNVAYSRFHFLSWSIDVLLNNKPIDNDGSVSQFEQISILIPILILSNGNVLNYIKHFNITGVGGPAVPQAQTGTSLLGPRTTSVPVTAGPRTRSDPPGPEVTHIGIWILCRIISFQQMFWMEYIHIFSDAKITFKEFSWIEIRQ